MLHAMTFEKVEEVIGLAEKARWAPDEQADDPRRGGTAGDRGVSSAVQPMEPQPAPDWKHAITCYLEDLPNEALAEILGLYRFGRGEFDRVEDAVAASRQSPEPHRDRVAYLASRPDLPACLRTALKSR